jgi:hypothetical protein
MKTALFAAGSLLTLACAPAGATQITLGSSVAGVFDFVWSGTGSVSIDLPTDITGPASFGADIGTYDLGPFTATAGPLSGSNFPVGPNSGSFTVTMGDGDAVNGNINWTALGTAPQLGGTFDIASAVGDTGWLAAWTAGEVASVALDLSVQPPGAAPLSATAFSLSGSTFASVTGGNVGSAGGGDVGPIVAIPEPRSLGLVLLGLGLLAIRLRRRSV